MYSTKNQEMSGMHANRTKVDQKNKEKTRVHVICNNQMTRKKEKSRRII